jgi:BRCT domain type II-containing protein
MLAVDEERNHLLRLVDDYKEELSSQLMKYELMQEDNTTLTKSIEQLQNAQSTAKPSTSNTFTQTPTSSKSSAYTQTDPSEQISPLEIKRLNVRTSSSMSSMRS